MEKQLMIKRGNKALMRETLDKQGIGVQALSVEVITLLDVFARIELRRQGRQRASKEVR